MGGRPGATGGVDRAIHLANRRNDAGLQRRLKQQCRQGFDKGDEAGRREQQDPAGERAREPGCRPTPSEGSATRSAPLLDGGQRPGAADTQDRREGDRDARDLDAEVEQGMGRDQGARAQREARVEGAPPTLGKAARTDHDRDQHRHEQRERRRQTQLERKLEIGVVSLVPPQLADLADVGPERFPEGPIARARESEVADADEDPAVDREAPLMLEVGAGQPFREIVADEREDQSAKDQEAQHPRGRETPPDQPGHAEAADQHGEADRGRRVARTRGGQHQRRGKGHDRRDQPDAEPRRQRRPPPRGWRHVAGAAPAGMRRDQQPGRREQAHPGVGGIAVSVDERAVHARHAVPLVEPQDLVRQEEEGEQPEDRVGAADDDQRRHDPACPARRSSVLNREPEGADVAQEPHQPGPALVGVQRDATPDRAQRRARIQPERVMPALGRVRQGLDDDPEHREPEQPERGQQWRRDGARAAFLPKRGAKALQQQQDPDRQRDQGPAEARVAAVGERSEGQQRHEGPRQQPVARPQDPAQPLPRHRRKASASGPWRLRGAPLPDDLRRRGGPGAQATGAGRDRAAARRRVTN